MRSLSLRSGNSPTTPYGGRVNGLQGHRFPSSLPSKLQGSGSYPGGSIPRCQRASLCWTHVGSRTGAPTVGSGGKSNHFRVGPQSAPIISFQPPPPQTQHAVFPHYAFLPASRQGLCAYSAFAFTYILRLRSCSSIGAFLISPLPPMSSKSLQTAGPLPSTGVTRLHRYYQPLRHPLACQPISRCCRLYGLPLLRRFLNGARRASPVA